MISAVPMPAGEQRGARPAVERRLVERRLAAGAHPELATRAAERITDRALDSETSPQAWALRHGDDVVGSAWTVTGDGRSYLIDLEVPAERAPDARRALADALAPEGVEQLIVDVLAGDAVTAAVVDGTDAILQASQMQLDLTAPVGAPARVVLHPMSGTDLAAYRRQLEASYAQDMFDAGAFPDLESARRASVAQVDALLPDGPLLPGHHLWTAADGATAVGILWIYSEGAAAFIYDIEVRDEQRRRGYGREILDAGARAASELGAEVLGLNVFGDNKVARAMYEAAGYVTTEQTCRVVLLPD